MVVQRSAELSDEQLMARLGGPELDAALHTLRSLQPHSLRSGLEDPRRALFS